MKMGILLATIFEQKSPKRHPKRYAKFHVENVLKMNAKDIKTGHMATKPDSWNERRPNGCAMCRYVAGCTPSCWKLRGEIVPAD